MTTEERIIDSAAYLFSRKGYKNTSIKEISQRADVNSLTVFRYFHDKDALFFLAVEHMKKSAFDPEALDKRLSFRAVEDDLMVIGLAYWNEIYLNLPLIRVYIGEGSNFEWLQEEQWFIAPTLKKHFQTYVETLDAACALARKHASLLAEMLISYITRKVMAESKYQDTWEKTPEAEASFIREFIPQASCLASMITGL